MQCMIKCDVIELPRMLKAGLSKSTHNTKIICAVKPKVLPKQHNMD